MSVNVEKVVRKYIDKSPHLSLATVNEGKPWVCEVSFVYDEDLNLYFVSKPTTRHCQEMAVNPYVAGNIVKQHAPTEERKGIYFEGKAEMITNPSDEVIRWYGGRFNYDTEEIRGWLRDGMGMYRIQVKSWAVFGDFDGTGKIKSELAWGQA